MEYNKTEESNESITNYFLEDPLLFNNYCKTIVNINKQRTEPAFRAYKDESTSCFVSTFFKNEDVLNYFVYYNFQTLHYFILANINQKLKINNEVLKADEELLITFKGGNVMHFYFNKFLNIIKQNLPTNTEEEKEYAKKVDDLNKYFKISDVDTSVYIINNDEKKYNLIYYYVSDLLVKSLIFIRTHFNNILNKTEEYTEKEFPELPSNMIYITPYNNKKYDLYTIHNLYKDIALLFENTIKNNNYDNLNDKLDELTNYFFSDNNKILIFKDSYVGSRVITTLHLIKYYYDSNKKIKNIINKNNKLSDLVNNIDNISEIQDKTILTILNNKLAVLNNFYTKEKVDELLNKIIEKYNSADYQNKTFYNQNSNPPTKYSIREQVQPSELIIEPRKDFTFRSVDSIEFNKLIMFTDSSNHFISVNNIISSYVGANYILSFDLYRIKFSIKLNKIFNETTNKNVSLSVPSEFLDISISKYYDDNLCKLREKAYSTDGSMYYFSKLDNNRTECYNVLSINLKYTIKDLDNVLYNQNFIPWNDAKYDKRIIRLLFLIFVVYYKNGIKNNCIEAVDQTLNNLIINLTTLSNNILAWFADQSNESLKQEVLTNINKLIYFNNENNLLNIYTLCNFYDYQNKNFFKIKYFEKTNPNADKLSHVFHGELDLSINLLTKIIFFAIEDMNIYKSFVDTNLTQSNYVFNSPADKKEYIDKTFLVEYVEYIRKFVDNFSFMKNLIFNNLKTNSNIPTDDLLIGGARNVNGDNIINTNGKTIQFSNLKYTDVPFKTMKKLKFYNINNLSQDFEDLEMLN